MPTANSTEGDNSNTPVTDSDTRPDAPQPQPNAAPNADSNSSNNVSSGEAPQRGQQPASPARAADADLSEFLTEVRAMPERVVNSLREALLPAQAPRNDVPGDQSQSAGSGSQSAVQTGSEPGRKTFTDWWFGK